MGFVSLSSPREKNKKKIYFFEVNSKHISSHVLKISVNSLVLRTREFTDIFITFDEIYLVFTSKKVNILMYLTRLTSKKITSFLSIFI